jgi:hypothetical protein
MFERYREALPLLQQAVSRAPDMARTAIYFKRPEETEHLVAGVRMAGFPE